MGENIGDGGEKIKVDDDGDNWTNREIKMMEIIKPIQWWTTGKFSDFFSFSVFFQNHIDVSHNTCDSPSIRTILVQFSIPIRLCIDWYLYRVESYECIAYCTILTTMLNAYKKNRLFIPNIKITVAWTIICYSTATVCNCECSMLSNFQNFAKLHLSRCDVYWQVFE